uniref:Receptor ligand binding region domain-containing protein n=1 Tax=Panagrolaimus sp. JU765 TaxID=591449 RepID=A0AC34Q2B0_9BILA
MSLTAFRSVVDVETIRLQTRVIIVLMGSQLGANQEALQLLNRVGIAAPEFVILLPWINHDPDQYYPWITVADNKSVVINRELKKTFVGAYVVDADRQMSPTGRRFFSTLEQYNLTSNYDGASYDLALLYDCLKLYVLAVNASYTQFGSDGISDPTKVVDEFAGLEFEGASGQVEMDLADSRI